MTGSPGLPVVWGKHLGFWTRFALLWLMVVTVTGAAVRLTGSGLGCTDWPTCNVNTELDAPGYHSAIEFGNRVFSGLAIIPVIAAWWGARVRRPDLLVWIWLLVVGFIGQVLLGMLVTRTELDPRVVLGHFLLSIVLIFLAAMLDHSTRSRAGRPDSQAAPARLDDDVESHRTMARHSWAVVAMTTVVIVVGTLVTGSGPHTGSDESGEAIPRLGFAIREITRVHSVLVWVLGAVLAWGLWRARELDTFHRGWLQWLTIGGVAQGAIGYTQYWTGVPVLLVGFHIAGAVTFFAGVVLYAARASEPSPDADLEMAGTAVGAT